MNPFPRQGKMNVQKSHLSKVERMGECGKKDIFKSAKQIDFS